MATQSRPKFSSECFTSPWTSVTAYNIDEQATTVTAMVGCPSPFRAYESPINGDFASEHVTNIPDLPQCCGPFTKASDPELDYLEGTNILCPENYGITKEKETDGTTKGQCVATVDGIKAVETNSDLPTITQIASFHVNWDQAVLSEKYGVTMMAPTASSAVDADDGGTSDSSESGPNIAAIVAPSVIGGLVFIGILVFAAWCTQRRRSRSTKPAQHSPSQQQQQQPQLQQQHQQPQMQYPSSGVPVYSAPDAPAKPNPVYEVYEPVSKPQQQTQYPATEVSMYSAPNVSTNPNPVYEPVPVPQAYGH